MSTELKQPEKNVSKSTEERVVASSQQFWSKNSKFILFGLTAVVLVIAGFFLYKNYFKAPAEAAANEAIWPAQANFKVDSFRLVLNGNGTKANPGVLRIIKDHSGTAAGNLSKFYAGVSYLQLGDFNNAVKFLEDYSADRPALKMRAAGSLGDAYAELGKNDQAASSYKTASSSFEDDEVNTAEYLYRLGHLYDKTGKSKEAIETFKSLKAKYPESLRAREADKYLAKLGEVN
ncbi:MAG: tetratricopeptide repeat protein [Chitinophagaceae bacterium]|nr:tetratricopeptide repeat protein [Chitinophagaceae bacterium]